MVVRVGEGEEAKYREAARGVGRTVSGWARWVLNREVGVGRGGVEEGEELGAMGRALLEELGIRAEEGRGAPGRCGAHHRVQCAVCEGGGR